MRGFGSGTQKIIYALAEGTTAISVSGRLEHEEGSNRNGGAMRIAPIGLMFAKQLDAGNFSIDDLRKAVTAAILATHVHPEGIDGAVAVAFMVARSAVT